MLFLGDPAKGPRDGQVLALRIALGAGAVIMIAIRFVWGVTLKSGIRWRAPSLGASFEAPVAWEEAWVARDSQSAFVRQVTLEGVCEAPVGGVGAPTEARHCGRPACPARAHEAAPPPRGGGLCGGRHGGR